MAVIRKEPSIKVNIKPINEYKLTGEEVKKFIKHSESYKRNKEAQKKHTIILL